MTRLLQSILCLFAAFLPLFLPPAHAWQAGQETQAGETGPQTPLPARPALWKVADADTTIFVFGTVHVLPEGIGWFDGAVAEAFAASDELVTEIAEDDDDQQMQALLADMARLGDGVTLRGLLGAQEREAFETALGTLGLPPAVFDGFEPWYAAITLSTLPLLHKGYHPGQGVEKRLETEASARQMPHEGLETAQYQLSLFDSLASDVQLRYLGEVVEQLPTIRDELAAMVEAWRTGDADELAMRMNAQGSDPALMEALLVGRNRQWAAWVDERLARPGTVFLAVGAGHLAGEGSLQDQLAARGINTERVQ